MTSRTIEWKTADGSPTLDLLGLSHLVTGVALLR